MDHDLETPEEFERTPQYATVVRFTRALLQAIHDVDHEKSGKVRILHFWDTESLYLPARGATALPKPPFGTSLFVQALYATGFLGKVSLLRPHRAELIRKFSEWEDSSRELAANFARIRDHLQGSGDLARVLAIEHLLENKGDLTPKDLRFASELLRKLPRDEFIFVEAASGSWRGRAARLLDQDLLDLQWHGFPMSFLRETPEYSEIAEALRPRWRDLRRTQPFAADVGALTSLVYMLRQAPEDSRVYPRFFTSAPTLKGLYNDWPRLRGLLEFRDHRLPQTTATVWRDSVYYLVRAIMPPLHMPGRRQPENGKSISRDELNDIADRLLGALRKGDDPSTGDLRELLRMKMFEDGSDLARVITGLEDDRISSVWLSFAQDVEPEGAVIELRGLRQLAQDERIFDELYGYTRESVWKIRDEVREYRSVDAVAAALSRFAAVLGKDAISIRDDLASGRWGLDEDAEGDVISSDAVTGVAAETLLADFSVAVLKSEPRLQLRSCAILLGLEEYELASLLMANFSDGTESHQHRIMRRIADLRSKAYTDDSLAATVAAIETQWKDVPKKLQSKLALGFAIAIFSAWQLSPYGGKDHANPRDELGWAKASLDLVVGRLDSMTRRASLQAKNHLVYVATSAELPLEDHLLWVADLEQHANQFNDFHLLDTVGYYIFQTARKEDLVKNAEAQARFLQGVEYLARARALFPKDREVVRHYKQAVALGVDCGLIPKKSLIVEDAGSPELEPDSES